MTPNELQANQSLASGTAAPVVHAQVRRVPRAWLMVHVGEALFDGLVNGWMAGAAGAVMSYVTIGPDTTLLVLLTASCAIAVACQSPSSVAEKDRSTPVVSQEGI